MTEVINSWAMHYQSVWEDRSANPSLPLWVRISALAFGCHRRNGHANFKEGELSVLLGKPGDDGWVYVPPPSISRAIAAAKDAGWIAEESNSRCLVVPGHAVQGGAYGHPNERCAVHDPKRTGRR